MNFNAEDKARPVALAAGAIVGIGLIYFMVKKGQRCTEFPGIWTDDNPLHLTIDVQNKAFESARERVRAARTAGTGLEVATISLAVANEIQECDWAKRTTEKARQVWDGINKVVLRVYEEASEKGDEF